MTGIPATFENNKLDENVIPILKEIDVNVTSDHTETSQQIGKAKIHSTRTMVRFANQKFAKKVLFNTK